MTAAKSTSEKIIISEFILLKLATRVFKRLSYSFGSITRVRGVCMLPKNDVRTVPTSKT